MNKVIFMLCWLGLCNALMAQSRQDHIWMFGFFSDLTEDYPSLGGSGIDFNTHPPMVYAESRPMNINVTSAAICNEEGHLLAYSNGIYIANAQHDSLANSNNLSLDGTLGFEEGGMEIPQGALMLPVPEADQQFILIHEGYQIIDDPDETGLVLAGNVLYYTLFDLSLNNGAGAVTLKNQPLIQDTLDFGKIAAVRHSNGRDWWVVAPDYNNGLLFRFLLTPAGLQTLPPQDIGVDWRGSWGQAVFSPDGSKYVHTIAFDLDENYLTLCDFNRDNGTFNNVVQLINPGSGIGGVAISPNSRYLYHSLERIVYQYDLWAADVNASRDTVALYDGYEEYLADYDLNLPTTFFLAKLAPDGKIYIVSPYVSSLMHVINQPDLPGESCVLVQHHLALPRLNRFSLPNYPNFDLGPLAGSPGDTLGPIAAFNYTATGPVFDFEDNSSKNPTSWLWNFGDSQVSEEQNPQHTFPGEGLYPVCLTVANAYGRDTFCQEIMVIINDANEAESANIYGQLYPNPARSITTFSLSARTHLPQTPLSLQMLDVHGREIRKISVDLREGGNSTQPIDLSGLAAGIYWCVLRENGKVMWQKRLLKE